MTGIRAVFHWIGEHSTKLAAAVQAFLLMGSLLHWWVLTADQQVAVMAFVTTMLYVFVESNTVSKVRFGERLTEEVAKQTGASGSSESPTTSGINPLVPAVLLALALSAAAGCAHGMHNAARGEDIVHDALMAFDRSLDSRCSAGELTPETCQELYSLLVPVWDIKNNVNRAIAGAAPTTSLRLEQLRTAIQALVDKVTALVQGGARELLLRELDVALQQTGSPK